MMKTKTTRITLTLILISSLGASHLLGINPYDKIPSSYVEKQETLNQAITNGSVEEVAMVIEATKGRLNISYFSFIMAIRKAHEILENAKPQAKENAKRIVEIMKNALPPLNTLSESEKKLFLMLR